MNVSSMYSSTPAAATSSATSGSSSTSSSSSSDGLSSTFMTLLMSELQNQDPTSPMDTTQMVGQMISLNQLDAVMSIQSILQDSLGSSGTTTPTADSQTANHAANSVQSTNQAASAANNNAQSAYAAIAGSNPATSSQSIYGVN